MGLCSLPLVWPEAELLTHASTGDSWTLIGKSDSVSCGNTAPFSWILAHARFCMCSPSLFPQPCESSAVSSTGPLSQISWGFSVPLLDPQIGKSVVGPRAFLTLWGFFSILVLQFVGRLLCGSMLNNAAWPRSAAAGTPSPWQATANPCLCRRQTLKDSSGSGAWGAGPSHTGLWVVIPDVEPASFAG